MPRPDRVTRALALALLTLAACDRSAAPGGTATAAAPPPPTTCETGNADDCLARAAALPATADPEQRLALTDRGCELGSALACRLSFDVLWASAELADNLQGRDRLDRACDLDAMFCRFAAEVFRDGVGTERDLPRAVERYDRGCAAGDAQACLDSARLVRDGRGVPADDARALASYLAACNLNSVPGCFHAGMLSASNPAESQRLLDLACTRDHGLACTEIGRSLLRHSPGEAAAAAAMFERGCEKNDAEGCRERGLVALAAEDHTTASSWLTRACNAADLIACAEQARLLNSGLGVTANPLAARQLLDATCQQGTALSCWYLSEIYAQGSGVAADLEHARVLAEAACRRQIPAACSWVARNPEP